MDDTKYTTVIEAEQVTDEILTEAENVHNGWYAGRRIDWDDLLDRVDGMDLADGTVLDLGNWLNPDGTDESDAIKKIKKHIRAYRKL